MCQSEEHTTRRPIPWSMDSDMPHPYARKSCTDKSVTKAVSYTSDLPRVDGVTMPLVHKAGAQEEHDPAACLGW
jgi:hypothetical protein